MVVTTASPPDTALTTAALLAPTERTTWPGAAEVHPAPSWLPPQRPKSPGRQWTELAPRPREDDRKWVGLPDQPRSRATGWQQLPWSPDDATAGGETGVFGPIPGRLDALARTADGHRSVDPTRISPGLPLLAAVTQPRRSLEWGHNDPFSLSEADEPPPITGLSYIRTLAHGRQADILVYQSRQASTKLAVKVFHSSASYEQALALSAEVDAWAALAHPRIVRLLGAGVAHDGRCYVGLAYHPEGSLKMTLQQGPLKPSHVIRIGVQVADTLSTAHRAGLFHLNLKPSNILLDAQSGPVLTDCGPIARFAADPTGALALPWSPPEVVAATSPADARSDLYYLAATLWHLLTGHPPFESPAGDNTPTAMAERIAHGVIPPLKRHDVPPGLNHLLRATLGADPSHRPGSAAAFAQALRAIDYGLA